MESVVLGIDAAWTAHNPSGVALARKNEFGWKLLFAAPSYEHFLQSLGISERPLGSEPDVSRLLAKSQILAGTPVDLVAIDMPLSMQPITGRRASDDEISRIYGSRHASTHSPSSVRPGRMSDALRLTLETMGYPLLTEKPANRGLVEVYPHPAIIELCDRPARSPYKFANRRKYWPSQNPQERSLNLKSEWKLLATELNRYVNGISEFVSFEIEKNDASWRWKAIEDILDAIICVIVGICVLERKAKPYGDNDSAIWVPHRQ